MTNGYLLLHGWQNRRPKEHWHHWLSDELEAVGHVVAYPQLPSPDEPVLGEWLAVVGTELDGLEARGVDELVVVAHSLGAATAMHALASSDLGFQSRVSRVLLVSPPSTSAMLSNSPIAGFVLPERIGAEIPVRLVGSDLDPYCPEGVAAFYGPVLGLGADDFDLIPGGGHVSLDDGYGAWPAVLGWCLDPTTRLVPREAAR